ncbi:M13 family metallopeptidase [Lactobacillus sp. ESL0731]|uniref:M13 family metallopeptidase n=1 Tax=unclassified Lactobacillus TaxID=2620435 RepID=UPI0023F7FD4A|nr:MULTISPECIES: M13 family metallopeptidase [unclassified Lactobacillus]WEV52048.1 M13 family metallopeptidase [Lactobacillus sp. ESL0700]WEV63176.1 M13 family metallopeptidase [Lactobacillus sp. ESL0731]
MRPQDNLYLAINSKWLKNAKIPVDGYSAGAADNLTVKVNNELSQDMAAFANGKKPLPNIPNFAKAVDLYKQALDMDQRNRDGAEPIKKDLAALEGIKDFADFNTKAAKLFNENMPMPIGWNVEPDLKNARKNALYFGSASTILPDTTSYQDPNSKQLLDIFKKQSIKLLELAGVSEDEATTYAENAIKFDSKMAQNSKSAEDTAEVTSTYHPMSVSDFKAKFGDFDMAGFLQRTVGKDPDQIIVTDPDFLNNVNGLLNKENFAELKGWLVVIFINNVAGELSQQFVEASAPFALAESGQKELPSAAKQAYAITDSDYDDLIGQYYGQTYFGTAAKKDVTKMVKQILKIYEQRLQKNKWLSKATRQKAIAKLKAMKVKVGYPSDVTDFYDDVKVVPTSQGGSLYANRKAMAIQDIKENISELDEPVDRDDWGISGDEVNAFYDPSLNDINIPAGILQAPFYSKKQSKAANLGGIGAVIGHEISHAFDNNGSKFDEYGSLNNWWTKKDYAAFNKRVKAETKLFDGIKYDGKKVSGKLTVSENIADQGGLSVAIAAGKKDHVNLRELFKNYARIWRLKLTPQATAAMLATDVHSPNALRANVQVQCQPDFYKVFKVKKTDGMWLSPKKRVIIW